MFPFSDNAITIWELAIKEAQRFGLEHIGTESLLLAILNEGTNHGAVVLIGSLITVQQIRSEIKKRIQPGKSTASNKLPQTPRVQQAIKQAIIYVERLNQTEIDGGHLLLGLLADSECVATQVLQNSKQNIDELRKTLWLRMGGTAAEAETNVEIATRHWLNRMNGKAREVFRLAQIAAATQQRSVMDTEHLLIAIMQHDNNDAAFCLRNNGVTFEALVEKTKALFPVKGDPNDDLLNAEPPLTDTNSGELSSVARLSFGLQIALSQAGSISQKVINAEMLMLGLLHSPQVHHSTFNSTVVLESLGMNRRELAEEIRGYLFPQTVNWPQPDEAFRPASSVSERTPQLDQRGRSLIAEATCESGSIVSVDETVIEQMLTVLLRRHRNCVLLVGDRETTRYYLSALARRLAGPEIPVSFYEHRLLELDLSREHHAAGLAVELVKLLNEARRDFETILVYPALDELAAVQSGFGTTKTMLEILSSWLMLPGMRMVATVDPGSLGKVLTASHTLAEFERIDLRLAKGLKIEEILARCVPQLEQFHLVTFSESAIERAREKELAAINETDRNNPMVLAEAVLETLDRAAVAIRLQGRGVDRSATASDQLDLESAKSDILEPTLIEDGTELMKTADIAALDRQLRKLYSRRQTHWESGQFDDWRTIDREFRKLLAERIARESLPVIESKDLGPE